MSSCGDFTSWTFSDQSAECTIPGLSTCVSKGAGRMNRLEKSAILALCAIFFAASLQAQAAKPKAVVAEAIKDVGVAAKGEKVSHAFQIRNEGTATLEITEVVAACGCTVVEFDKTIAPGQAGKVNVVIDTETFAGP